MNVQGVLSAGGNPTAVAIRGTNAPNVDLRRREFRPRRWTVGQRPR